MASLTDRHKETELKEEFAWARTRALWVPIKNAFFKKEGGDEFQPSDLITLSFDKSAPAQPIALKKVKELLGARIKKDGK